MFKLIREYVEDLFSTSTLLADQEIDAAIERNRARYRPGMYSPDKTKLRSAGQRNWDRVIEAQANISTREVVK